MTYGRVRPVRLPFRERGERVPGRVGVRVLQVTAERPHDADGGLERVFAPVQLAPAHRLPVGRELGSKQ